MGFLDKVRVAASLATSHVHELIAMAERLRAEAPEKEAECRALLDEALSREPHNAHALKMMAAVCAASDRSRAAVCWQGYLALVPCDAKGWREFADNARARGDLGEALSHLERALHLAPGQLEFQLARAEVLAALGRADEALRATEQAIAAARPSAQALLLRARLLDRSGRREEAAAALAGAAKHGGTLALPEVLDALDGMGLSHLAPEHALFASGENGEDARPFRIVAERLVQSGDPAAALRLVESALAGNRASEWGRSELFLAKGEVLEALGEPADARRAYERALAELPHNAEARERLAALPPR